LDGWARDTRAAVAAFVARYHDYFGRHNARAVPPRRELDAVPRVVLVPGLGLFGVGVSRKDAARVADIAAAAVDCITGAEAVGRFTSISEAEMFDMEYWSLEQAKLGKIAELPFARQVVLITGGGSGIGAATARAFAREEAEVVILDCNGEAAAAVARACGPSALGQCCDVTDPVAVQEAFDATCTTYGGVDIVVSNAGAAWQGAIGEVDDTMLRASFELNFHAHQTVARAAVRVMRPQGTRGCLLFNTSKQAVNPGPGFGPYGLPKAATLALMKQYALDYGHDGIRANAVNADRIRSGLLTGEMIASRAWARGVTERDYLTGNLLGLEVTAEDVAAAFLSLAQALKTTACTLTVDGGNIAASMR
jgi:NAD(P)-dependent dehydrogenase (short-subunit alcohol dehydrogenase family)